MKCMRANSKQEVAKKLPTANRLLPSAFPKREKKAQKFQKKPHLNQEAANQHQKDPEASLALKSPLQRNRLNQDRKNPLQINPLQKNPQVENRQVARPQEENQ